MMTNQTENKSLKKKVYPYFTKELRNIILRTIVIYLPIGGIFYLVDFLQGNPMTIENV